MEKRKYITDNGYEMLLPPTDERVMTVDELDAKYATPKMEEKKKDAKCPRCGGYCYGDC